MVKTTFITTVLNEEKSLKKFLNSLNSQTISPDEIIIVDGGSKDNTLKIIKSHKFKIKKNNIKILLKRGNRSVSRNFAIKHAKNEIILCSDAGCILDKFWVEKIKAPFSKKIDVSSGYYKPLFSNTFEKALSAYTCVMPNKIDPSTYLPSSRSIAFRKSSWKKVGGYPEWLDTCEDLFFARELKRENQKFSLQKFAIVFWPQRKNIWEAFKQFFSYAKGDGKALYVRKNTPYLFIRYILGAMLVSYAFLSERYELYFMALIFLIAYVLWAIKKNYEYVKSLTAIIYLPLFQFISDIAVILGFLVGLYERAIMKSKTVL